MGELRNTKKVESVEVIGGEGQERVDRGRSSVPTEGSIQRGRRGGSAAHAERDELSEVSRCCRHSHRAVVSTVKVVSDGQELQVMWSNVYWRLCFEFRS